MNIAVISPPILRTPPEDYGGIEASAWVLCKGLAHRGHVVTLFGRHDSFRPPDKGVLLVYDDEKSLVAGFGNDIGLFDAVIDFTHEKFLSMAHPNWPIINCYSVMSLTGNGINPVFISHGQKAGKFHNIEGPVIYYGLDLDEYPLFTGRRNDYLLYMGMVIPEKRVEWACEVAIQTGHPLVIAGPWWGGPDYDAVLNRYRNEYPNLIKVVGSIGGQAKIELLQHAYTLIHPVGAKGWCEAGAIVALEALACGTPVLASNNGCLPEYILDEDTLKAGHKVGAICATLDEMVEAVRASVPMYCFAHWCRYRAEDFSMVLMAERYEALAIEVMNGKRWNVK